MTEVEDPAAVMPATGTESEGATTDEDGHFSPTSVCADADGGGGRRIKFLCSFGGRIMPRPSDGALKYVGGETRVLAVPRSIPFREMKKKVEDMFKTEVAAIKYQLLSLAEDLDVLVSITCDEDLVHMLDEYDRLEAKRSPTASPRFRLYIFAPQTTRTALQAPAPAPPAATATPASSRYGGFSRYQPRHHHHYNQRHHHHFQPERYVATVPVTPCESPRCPDPSHGTVSAGNSPRASAMAPESPVFERLGSGMRMQRVRSSPNLLGSLVDAAPHQHAADGGGLAGDGGGYPSSSLRLAGAGHLFVQNNGHHYQHQYAPAPAPPHMPHPAGAAGGRYVPLGNYHAPPMVPVARPSDRPLSRGGPVPHGGGDMQTQKKAELIWD